MPELPASILGMADRGFIAVGMAADLTVFDLTHGNRAPDNRAVDQGPLALRDCSD